MSMQNKILSLLAHLVTYNTEHELIRVGAADGDGGYLIPRDFDDVEDVVSLGISDDVSFDLYFAESGKKIHQFDPTVEGPPLKHANFNFYKEGFGVFENRMHHTLDTLLNKCNIDDGKNKLLKFDVEGSEYSAILASSREALRQFSIITGEFHALDWCREESYYNMIHETFRRLTEDFIPVHVHPNNGCGLVVIENIPLPPLIEVTYIRNDRVSNKSLNVYSKHHLDRKNVPSSPDIFWSPTHFFLRN